MPKPTKKYENGTEQHAILTPEHISILERLLAAGEKIELRLVKDELGIWTETKKRIR